MRYGQLVAVLLLAVFAVPAFGQDMPRTSWGTPDLQGVWDFRTITPLERPEELGEQSVLSEEETANLEQEAVDRDIREWNEEAERTEAVSEARSDAHHDPAFSVSQGRGPNRISRRLQARGTEQAHPSSNQQLSS